MCQVLFKGSRCIINLFTPLQSIFNLIYRWDIWLSWKLHRKESDLHTLLECPLSVSLIFYLTCPHRRTLPKVLWKIFFSLFFLFPPLVNPFIHSRSPGKLHHSSPNAAPLFPLPFPPPPSISPVVLALLTEQQTFFTGVWPLLS